VKVLVWGMGYVGTVTAAGLANLGHDVVGVEPNPAKVESLNAGKSAIKEPGLEDLIGATVRAGNLRATTEGSSLVAWSDVSLVCVGTPTSPDGNPNLEFIRRVADDIGSGLTSARTYHLVLLRSTVFPGIGRTLFGPLIGVRSGREIGEDFGLVSNPEFLRETTAIEDFYSPPYTVIGEFDGRSGDVAAELYRDIQAPVHRVALEEAELLKLASNAFHALKVGFANEIGRLADQLSLDSHAVMNLVCADDKLNISPAYLKPGFAFGGSCLPKDLRNLTFNARRISVQLPIMDAVLTSNRVQVEAAHVKINSLGARRVAVLGLSFKPHTDDLRESPIITLIQDLWKDGVDVVVHDPDIQPDQMLGSNREYLERQLPQLHRILSPSAAEAVEGAQVVVVFHMRPEFTAVLSGLPADVTVVDLIRIDPQRRPVGLKSYRGIAW
jgi:GDP-mannose 6-dehydrogenase